MHLLRGDSRHTRTDVMVYTALSYLYGGKIRWSVKTFDANTDVERTTIGRVETFTADWTDSGSLVGPGLTTTSDNLARP